jgi:hypothetical protein
MKVIVTTKAHATVWSQHLQVHLSDRAVHRMLTKEWHDSILLHASCVMIRSCRGSSQTTSLNCSSCSWRSKFKHSWYTGNAAVVKTLCQEFTKLASTSRGSNKSSQIQWTLDQVPICSSIGIKRARQRFLKAEGKDRLQAAKCSSVYPRAFSSLARLACVLRWKPKSNTDDYDVFFDSMTR